MKLANTIGLDSPKNDVIKVKNESEIPDIIADARKRKRSLYPISSGRNWGYGSALPPHPDSIILDLSALNKIIEINEEHGYTIVEPGVTQQQLYQELKKRNSRLTVPTTGAGPLCSLLGNALERGYGITPYQNHTVSLHSVRAYLGNGSVFEPSLKQVPGSVLDKIYPYDLGMDLTPLFCQSNLGIVTQGTIALAPTSQCSFGFLLRLRGATLTPELLAAIKAVKEELGDFIGGINLMNSPRALAMAACNEKNIVARLCDPKAIKTLEKSYGFGPWSGVGTIYCSTDLKKAIKKVVRKRFGKHCTNVVFFDRPRLRLAHKIISLPIIRTIPLLKNLGSSVETLMAALDIFEGKPSQAALPLAYLFKQDALAQKELDPANDGCGLIWYSPLVPIEAQSVADFVTCTAQAMRDRGLPPMITLTTISANLFDSTIPLVFDRKSPQAIENANACFEEIWKLNYAKGIVPYRLDITRMNKLRELRGDSQQAFATLKKALDPDAIIAPQRYM